ncbi:hypothetical protein [Actinocorallia longicatena]|uniref:Uncharacterized protein n=1 Tax=Actinocorallia longicatena TaxID=111803 RepID=A0ABP6QDZ0_9ACTN
MARQFGVRWPNGQVTILRGRPRVHAQVRIWRRGGIAAEAVTRLTNKDWTDPWHLDAEGPRNRRRPARAMVGGGAT